MSYNHQAETKKLNEIMSDNYNATRNPGQQTMSKKVDILDALRSLQNDYAKIGRNVPSFSDSMDLIAHQHSE